MRLTLIRHGQTPSNVAGLLDTAPPGPGLTDLGRLQAAAIPPALRDVPVEGVFASNQLRAQQTATPLAQARKLDLAVLPGLREIAAGRLEMAGDTEAIRAYIGTLWAWLDGDLDRSIPDGPTGREVLDRIDAAVDEIVGAVGRDASAVAVSHGAAIRLWAATRASNVEPTVAGGQHLDNTGAVVLERSATGVWTVVSWSRKAIGGDALDEPARSGPTT